MRPAAHGARNKTSNLAICGLSDRRANARIGAAATKVGNTVLDVGVARVCHRLEQCGRRHQHSRLTVTALRYLLRYPGSLKWMATVGRKSFDGGNLPLSNVAETDRAGPHGVAVDVHGAGSAG